MGGAGCRRARVSSAVLDPSTSSLDLTSSEYGPKNGREVQGVGCGGILEPGLKARRAEAALSRASFFFHLSSFVTLIYSTSLSPILFVTIIDDA